MAWTTRMAKPLCLSLLFWAYSLALFAEEGAAMKIGFVDLDSLTRQSAYIQELMQEMEADIKALEKKCRSKEQELEKAASEFQRKETVWNEEERDKKAAAIRKLKMELEGLQYRLEKEVRKAEQEKMAPALNTILETMEKLGQEEDYDLILRGKVVYYGKPIHNLTGKMLERLEKLRQAKDTDSPAPEAAPVSDKEPDPTPAPLPAQDEKTSDTVPDWRSQTGPIN